MAVGDDQSGAARTVGGGGEFVGPLHGDLNARFFWQLAVFEQGGIDFPGGFKAETGSGAEGGRHRAKDLVGVGGGGHGGLERGGAD